MKTSPLSPAEAQLIDALAELAVEDYLRSLASNDGAPDPKAPERVSLPPLPKAA